MSYVVPFAKANALDDRWDLEQSPNIPGAPMMKHDEDKAAYICRELDFSRLDGFQGWLCWAGRPFNIHALHRQKMMQRDVKITQQADLHLVWFDHITYVKPLPSFLLDYNFFEHAFCATDSPIPRSTYDAARGFLLPYAKLVSSEADHRIAVGHGLIPDVSWDEWSAFAAEIIHKIPELSLKKRWWYGELRLPRLNKIFRLRYGTLQGYHFGYKHYRSFFDTIFGPLVVIFIYITTALTAIQVILACTNLNGSMVLQRTFFNFGIACLLVVLAVVLTMGAVWLYLLVTNLHATFSNERKHKRRKEEYGTGLQEP